MNPNHLRRNEDLLEKLASEYVLGTLRGPARRRFERWMSQDTVIRQAVTRWQARLNPLAEFVPAVPPSPQVWTAIEKQLNLGPTAKQGWLQRLQENVHFWRRLSFASSAMAAILLAVLLVREPHTASDFPSHVATLADEQNQTVLLATPDPAGRNLTVHVVNPPSIAPDRDLELWAIPPDGKPRSLGLLAQQGKVTLPLPAELAPHEAPVLAVSLEPRGGAPAGSGPTGPVLFKGQWIRVQG
jgi:anti-sigma-K factor RskA